MDPLLEAFLGPGFRRGAFNTEAALIPFWPAYRSLPFLQIISFFVFVFLWFILSVAVFSGTPVLGLILAVLAMSVLHGAGGNTYLWRRANQVRAAALKRGLEGEAALEYMRQQALPSRAGLLVAGVPGIGLLIYLLPATMPHDHGKIYLAVMKSDLRNLLTAQEVYFAEAHRYAESVNDLVYDASTNVLVQVTAADSNGWSARAFHNSARDACGIYVGTAEPLLRGSNEGEPRCGRRNQFADAPPIPVNDTSKGGHKAH